MKKLLLMLAGSGLLIVGCASEEEQLRSEMRDVREAHDELREAEIRQQEAAAEAAEDVQDDVEAAKRKLEREREEVREELRDEPADKNLDDGDLDKPSSIDVRVD